MRDAARDAASASATSALRHRRLREVSASNSKLEPWEWEMRMAARDAASATATSAHSHRRSRTSGERSSHHSPRPPAQLPIPIFSFPDLVDLREVRGNVDPASGDQRPKSSVRSSPFPLQKQRFSFPDLVPEMEPDLMLSSGLSSTLVHPLPAAGTIGAAHLLASETAGVKDSSTPSSNGKDCVETIWDCQRLGTTDLPISVSSPSSETEDTDVEVVSHQSHRADVVDLDHRSLETTSNISGIKKVVLSEPTPVISSAGGLPFVKSFTLWGSLESMEIFKIMKQEPHFHVLGQQFSGVVCEGMAIGLMLTFTKLAADIKRMKMCDTQETFDESLKALTQLEDNGFDVQRLRSQIEELLDIRSKHSEFQKRETSLKAQMIEIERRKGEIHVAAKEAERRLAELKKKNDDLVKQNATVVKDLQVTHEACWSAEQKFQASVSSPW